MHCAKCKSQANYSYFKKNIKKGLKRLVVSDFHHFRSPRQRCLFLLFGSFQYEILQLKPMTPRRIPASSPALLMSVISGSRTVLLPADKGSIVAFDGPFHNVIA